MATEDVKLRFSNYDSFDPFSYIKRKYATMSELVAVPLREMHSVFTKELANRHGGSGGLKILDYGCGPVPIYLCSVPESNSEIVFAEYGEANRDVIRMWVDNTPGCPDYTPFFKYTVQDLEGQIGDGPVLKRQEDLRKLIKAVVPCDATKDPPIAPGYEGPYDYILCSLCLTVTAANIEEYSSNLGRVTSLLKPGGKLFLNSIEARQGDYFMYNAGMEEFYALSMNTSSLERVLRENGYVDAKMIRTDIDETPGAYQYVSPEVSALIFVVATKL